MNLNNQDKGLELQQELHEEIVKLFDNKKITHEESIKLTQLLVNLRKADYAYFSEEIDKLRNQLNRHI
jgi:hypothetical protein